MYRWNDLGLKNVWLVNGYTLHETPYGRGVSFEDVEGLTRAVSLELARKPSPAGKNPARSRNGQTA